MDLNYNSLFSKQLKVIQYKRNLFNWIYVNRDMTNKTIMIKVSDNTERVNVYAQEAMTMIKHNAEHGNPYTDLVFPKHLAGEIRKRIEELLEDTYYKWCTMDRRPSELSGKMASFFSITIGNERHYKLKILS